MWSDDQFDYFRTSDGILYCSPRNFEREAAEAECERLKYRTRLKNKILLFIVAALVSVDIAVLMLLLCMEV